MKVKTKQQNILYALHYKGQLLGTFDWGGGTAGDLQGWRPPKKVYFTIGQASSGAAHLPKEMLDDIEIVAYEPVKVVKKIDSKELAKRRLQRELKHAEDILSYYKNIYLKKEEDLHNNNIKSAEDRVNRTKKQLEELNSSN